MEAQQDSGAKKENSIYVEKPDGEEIDIKEQAAPKNESPEEARQTAENIPTTASSEVTDGEDA